MTFRRESQRKKKVVCITNGQIVISFMQMCSETYRSLTATVCAELGSMGVSKNYQLSSRHSDMNIGLRDGNFLASLNIRPPLPVTFQVFYALWQPKGMGQGEIKKNLSDKRSFFSPSLRPFFLFLCRSLTYVTEIIFYCYTASRSMSIKLYFNTDHRENCRILFRRVSTQPTLVIGSSTMVGMLL